MLKVHHLNNSRSQRVVWLCEELGIEYELVKHMRDAETLRSPPSLYAVHPLGKAPTIVHGGQTMNPSAGDIKEAIDGAAGDAIIVLPNNKNIVLAAEQAAFEAAQSAQANAAK